MIYMNNLITTFEICINLIFEPISLKNSDLSHQIIEDVEIRYFEIKTSYPQGAERPG